MFVEVTAQAGAVKIACTTCSNYHKRPGKAILLRKTAKSLIASQVVAPGNAIFAGGGAIFKGGNAIPDEGNAIPCRGMTIPRRGVEIPYWGIAIPWQEIAIPRLSITIPRQGIVIPSQGTAIPCRGIAHRQGRIAGRILFSLWVAFSIAHAQARFRSPRPRITL